MTDLPLRLVAENADIITLGWDNPPPGTDGYTFWVDGKRISRTLDPSRRSVKFNKSGTTYNVRAIHLSDLAIGTWPRDPAVQITTAGQLRNALMQAVDGDMFDVIGTFAGQYDATCKGGRFNFARATMVGGTNVYCAIHAIKCAAKLESVTVVGGGTSGGILVNGGCDGLLLSGEIRDCRGTGLMVQGIQGTGSNEWVEAHMTIRNCGTDWANDPHVVNVGGQPGTGWHACYWGGAQLPSKGIAKLRVFDQPSGAAIQIGANAQDLTVDIEGTRITRNVEEAPFGTKVKKQVAGNLIQLWGGNNRNIDIVRAVGTKLAGRMVETDALDAPSSNIVVRYGRGTDIGYNRPPGVKLAAYAPGKGIVTYQDCQ